MHPVRLLRPDQCVPVAVAVLRVFIAHGDRTDRTKARLKYVLDRWGVPKFLDAMEAFLGSNPGPEPIARGSFYRNQVWIFDPAG